MIRLKERMEQKKKEAEIQDRASEIEMEKRRREMGKQAQLQAEEWKRQQLLNEAEKKRKEKEKDRLAREIVRKKIEQDRLNRESSTEQNVTNQPTNEESPVAPVSNRDTSTIQFRLPDRTTMKDTFELTTTLQELEDYILNASPQIGSFTMMTTFPRRVYERSEYHLNLEEAGLSGRPQIVIQTN
eukprot:TRINITY_DN5284_c0_g1_i2.p1 TRINITY_DN5284_c0_g1~~TRINITY_DN5284_c0_g1_i2.p1  ORF type:complete len:185 (+),score=44.07 TRINITY_DN5284_c0_g1_i2:380-934(+)